MTAMSFVVTEVLTSQPAGDLVAVRPTRSGGHSRLEPFAATVFKAFGPSAARICSPGAPVPGDKRAVGPPFKYEPIPETVAKYGVRHAWRASHAPGDSCRQRSQILRNRPIEGTRIATTTASGSPPRLPARGGSQRDPDNTETPPPHAGQSSGGTSFLKN
jgi:hypothetical protein